MPKDGRVQKICKAARDELDVRRMLEAVCKKPEDAKDVLDRAVKTNISVYKFEEELEAIDNCGRKSILECRVLEGKESKAFWADVFQDMASRGLKKVQLFVTDDFLDVRKIIAKLYPFSDHQLCYVHMERNLMRRLSRRACAAARPHVYVAKESQTQEDGLKHFADVCAIIAKEGLQNAARLEERARNYLAFLGYPA
ncbi:MAG TPA: transposase [Nitrososphaera sp.]|nr:transposase [Nitrososphaera sp.]